MASSVVENVMGTVDFPSLNHAPDQHTSEPSQYNVEDKAYSASFSVYKASTSIIKSGSPECDYDYSSFSTQGKDCSNKNGEQTKSYLEENSLSLKSNYSQYDFEKILNDSSLQQKLNKEPGSQSSIDAILGGKFDSYKSSNVGLEKTSENKWDFNTDYSSFACEKTTTSKACDKSKACENLSKSDLKSDNFKTKSQSFDFESLMQTYNFEASKETTNTSETGLDATKKQQARSSFDFEATEVAMRLRNSVQSNFLSSELWKGPPPKTDDTKIQDNSAIRTIEEILKHHGISDNVPGKSGGAIDDTCKKAANSSTGGQADLSQNNECSTGMTKAAGSETGQFFSSMKDKDPSNVYTISGNKDLNSSFKTDPTSGALLPGPKSFTTQGASIFTTNSSQNNETPSKSQNTTDSDPLKRYGSSVDYNATGKYGMHSGSTNFRMYDFGKSSLSGDTTRSSMHFSAKDSKQFEGGTEMSKYDSPQADGKPTFNASKASHIDIIKHLGSATDALEYSMSTERQRLRKLDTMISATPFNYSSLEVPRALRAQYISPERTYSSIMSSDLPSRRIYSTSNMPSTSTQGSRYPTRNPMSGNVGQRDSSTALNKSISAPGSAGMQSVGNHGSSVDGRAMYWPYGSKRDYNMQYNNAYNPQLLEKLVIQKHDISSQKKLPAGKRKDCSLKSKREECGKRNEQLLSYHQTPTGINFLNSSQMKKPTTAEKKKIPGKLDTKKKSADKDFNHSKNIGGLYDGFDFVKDLNRMWQETIFGPTQKPASNQKGKYMPYKPASQDKKEAKPTGGQGPQDLFGNDLWRPSIQRSDSNWTLNSSTGTNGKLHSYGKDYSLDSVQKVRSQCSMGVPCSGQTKSKGSNSSLMKTKINAPSSMITKQQPATPKSILKQPNNTKPGCIPSHVIRPQSSTAASSKSCTQTAYQLPYHLIRGFSPVEPHKVSRSNTTAALVKKQEPSSNKRLVSRTSTISKQGRRI